MFKVYILVSFPVAMIKCPDKTNVGKKEFILIQYHRPLPYCFGELTEVEEG